MVRKRDTRGFTLIEVAIAVAVLVAVLAGVAGVWAMAAASTRAAREQTLAMQLARDKLEQLAALTWAVQSVDGVDVLASDVTTNVSRVPATTDGAGTRASPSDSLGVSRATYADYLDARGRWLDAGPRRLRTLASSAAGGWRAPAPARRRCCCSRCSSRRCQPTRSRDARAGSGRVVAQSSRRGLAVWREGEEASRIMSARDAARRASRETACLAAAATGTRHGRLSR